MEELCDVLGLTEEEVEDLLLDCDIDPEDVIL